MYFKYLATNIDQKRKKVSNNLIVAALYSTNDSKNLGNCKCSPMFNFYFLETLHRKQVKQKIGGHSRLGGPRRAFAAASTGAKKLVKPGQHFTSV